MAFNVMAAKQAGYSDQEIQQYLQQKGGQTNIATNPALQTQNQGGLLKSLLPLGGSILGGILGLPLGPAGVIGGGALGGGAGAALSGQDLGGVGKEALLGSIGGLFPAARLGKVAQAGAKVAQGGLAKTIGGKVAGAGESLATRAIRPSPSQYTEFLEKSSGKQTIGKFIAGKGLIGKQAQQVRDTVIQPLQKNFDDIAENSNLQVGSDQLFQKFNSRIQTLRQSLAEGDQTKANKLENTMMKIIDKYIGKPIPAKELTKQRRNFDDYVKDFNNPVEAEANDEVRRLLQTTLQEAADTAGLTGPAGQSLKQLGLELEDLYRFAKIAGKQEGLGKGSLPFGITRLGGAITGGAVGGSYGPEPGYQDNLRNALLGMGLVSLANNPRVISTLAKTLISGGEKISKIPTPAGLGSNILGQTGARMLAGGGQLAQPSSDLSGLPQSTLAGQPQAQTQPDMTDILKRAALQDLATGGKNITKIIALSGFLNPPIGAATRTQLQQIEGAQTLVNQLESAFNQASQAGEVGPFGRGTLSTVTGRVTGGLMAENALIYDNIREGFTALIARSTGERGVLTDADAARAKKLLPTANMSPKTAARQFNEIRKIFQDAQARIGGAGAWTIPRPSTMSF